METHKQQALYSYKKYKAYQPLTTYWAEAGQIVHSEFRDGNVPAGHQQLRVLTEALEHLPAGVNKVMLRPDTAGYQQELLRYCAEGRDDRFGVIGFAVGVDMTPAFKRAVSEVAEEEWHVLYRKPGQYPRDTGQQWAEVNFVPDWVIPQQEEPRVSVHRHQRAAERTASTGNGGTAGAPLPNDEAGQRGMAQGLWSGDQPRPC